MEDYNREYWHFLGGIGTVKDLEKQLEAKNEAPKE